MVRVFFRRMGGPVTYRDAESATYPKDKLILWDNTGKIVNVLPLDMIASFTVISNPGSIIPSRVVCFNNFGSPYGDDRFKVSKRFIKPPTRVNTNNGVVAIEL